MSRRHRGDVRFTIAVTLLAVPLAALTLVVALVIGYVAALTASDLANTLSR